MSKSDSGWLESKEDTLVSVQNTPEKGIHNGLLKNFEGPV